VSGYWFAHVAQLHTLTVAPHWPRSGIDVDMPGITVDDAAYWVRGLPPGHVGHPVMPATRSCRDALAAEQPTVVSGLLAEFLGTVDQAAVSRAAGDGIRHAADAAEARGWWADAGEAGRQVVVRCDALGIGPPIGRYTEFGWEKQDGPGAIVTQTRYTSRGGTPGPHLPAASAGERVLAIVGWWTAWYLTG
jgi:hypothetical protein